MPGTTATTTALERVLAHLAEHEDAHLNDLQEMVRIPSVSADPAYKDDVLRAADWLKARLERAGMEHAEIVPTSGYPSVIADWCHAGDDAPTLLVYGHYDVQPAKKEDGWIHEPFGAVVEDGRVWGRGTTDDKGQFLAHVLAAEAWLAAAGSLPINLKMVFEGEEEVGSEHFGEVIDACEDRLRADVLVVSDSPMRNESTPAITHSLRGLVYMLIDVEGPRSDLHSGTWGGVVWNPNEALAHILASMKDPATGKVLVPGFYDDVVEPPAEERRRLEAVSESEKDILDGTGSPATFGEAGWSHTERAGIRPTLEINGVWGGYTGEGSKTVIPASAHAKVSCRIVADQDGDKIAELVRAHIDQVAPAGVRVTFRVHSKGKAVRSDPDHPMVGAIEAALEATFGNRPLLIPEGGSIPAVADMQERLGVVPILVGFGNKDENMHAPDESYRLSSFRKGREAAARMIAELGQRRS